MNFNPANWAIVNALQGQSNNTGQTFSSSVSNGYGGTSPSYASTPSPTTNQAVLGANTVNSDQGQVSQGGQWAPDTTTYNQTSQAGASEAKRMSDLKSGFDTQKNQTFDSFNTRLDSEARGMRGSILDFLDQYRAGQQSIDKAGRENAYAKQSGMEGIMGMVGRGVKQGGMMLQNRNASDSSAAGEIAKAYAQLGQREASTVGQQYEQGMSSVADQQALLATQESNFNRDFEDEKTNVANEIVTSTMEQLSSLDAQMADASMPERIAIEQERNRIKSEATAKLSQYDSMLRSERAKIAPTSRAEQQRQAAEMMSSGASYGGELFDYNTEAPAIFQGTGPFSSELPIFTRPRTNREG